MIDIKGISAIQRRDSILEMLKQEDKVAVSILADKFSTSEVTIRSDLAEMEQSGLLKRVHGGAVSTRKTYYEMSLNDRMDINMEEKIRIAKACAELVEDGDALMIDSGTTTRYLARELADRSNLTVVTNALLISQEFAFSRSVNVILMGGILDLQYQFTYGNDIIHQLHQYRADKTIIAANGISVKHGLTTYHHHESDVCRQIIERAKKVICVADHSKIGNEGFSKIAPITSVDVLVTDKCDSSVSELEAMRQIGLTVIEV
jgi:DeoR/GlpR family transcriptional regulator of sugar metabolism